MPLKPLKFMPFTAQQLKPEGWLAAQLRIQADGLSGHLDKIWPDIRDSKWIGGDKEGWERVPYWLDGFIPLAWLLEDADMQSRATAYIDAILSRQQDDGWLCPCTQDERRTYDVWAFFLICKVLVVYHDCTGDERIESAVYRALQCLNRHLDGCTLFNWSATRWYEGLIALFWLYERRPEDWMEELMVKLYAQGTDYEKVFQLWPYSLPQSKGRWNFLTHVVNLAMCLKAQALVSRFTDCDPDTFAQKALSQLLQDHGMASGHFTGDECLAGTGATQGSECCSVAEAMYSFECLLSVSGNADWADQLENDAFNALPATLSADMWAHQYDQMTNQIECSRFAEKDVPFLTNGPDSNLFGLEPNYGCCTANFNQAWPKFALSCLMRASDGLAVTAISPCRLTTQQQGVSVTLTVETDYPFEDGYRVRLHTDTPVCFALHLRIPKGALCATVNGTAAAPGFFTLKKEWCGDETITVSFDFEPVLVPRPNGLFCVRRGPLLYALPIKTRYEKLEYTRNGVVRKFPYCDYELFATEKWNYGFAGTHLTLERKPLGPTPFSVDGAPLRLHADLVEIDWPKLPGRCAELPADTAAQSAVQDMVLIPYGCTDLRMTEMPMANTD